MGLTGLGWSALALQHLENPIILAILALTICRRGNGQHRELAHAGIPGRVFFARGVFDSEAKVAYNSERSTPRPLDLA